MVTDDSEAVAAPLDDHAPGGIAPGATAALVWGILSLVFFGLIVGFAAINSARDARRLIALHPAYAGVGIANAGFGLGVVGIVIWTGMLLHAIAGGT